MDLNEILPLIQGFIAQYAMKVIGAIVTLIIGFRIIGWITGVAKKNMEKREMDPSIRPFLASIINIGFKVLLLLSVASMFGIEVTSFVAVFSAMAFAVGLALQGNLANFASGVLILTFKPFKVGDFIQAQGHAGTVQSIQIFQTVLQALDQRHIIIPNAQLTSGPIENFTVTGKRRHDLTLGVSYDDDIDKTREIIERVLKATPDVELEDGYDIFLKELGDSSVNFAVRFVCTNENYWPAFKHFMVHIKKAFDAEGINIPYPQMDVHVKK